MLNKYAVIIIISFIILTPIKVTQLFADPLDGAIDGAIIGGVIGGAAGGKKGADTGVAAGAVIGAIGGAIDEAEMEDAMMEMDDFDDYY